jgi:hypothetical protein
MLRGNGSVDTSAHRLWATPAESPPRERTPRERLAARVVGVIEHRSRADRAGKTGRGEPGH